MKPPEEVKLSREGGEALIERIKASNLVLRFTNNSRVG
jgi:hypothetical protein